METGQESTSTYSTLRRILDSVDSLRPLPITANRLLKALDDPLVAAKKVTDLVRQDVALTAHILRVANSVYMGYSRECSSVAEGVMRIGYKRIRTMVLGSVAAGPLRKRLVGYQLGDGVLWNHSIAAGRIAHWLAATFKYPEPEEAYVAGLLHDMGKLILDRFVNMNYEELMDIVRKRQMHLWEAEEEFFGIDHAAVGGEMASKWQFPARLVNAIRCHHVPALARTDQKLAAIVNVANAFTPRDALTVPGLDGRVPNPIALKVLNLDAGALNDLWNRMQDQVKFDEEIFPQTSDGAI